jgi:hypothetical protein
MLQILSTCKGTGEQYILVGNSTEAVSSDREIKFDEDIVVVADNSNESGRKEKIWSKS